MRLYYVGLLDWLEGNIFKLKRATTGARTVISLVLTNMFNKIKRFLLSRRYIHSKQRLRSYLHFVILCYGYFDKNDCLFEDSLSLCYRHRHSVNSFTKFARELNDFYIVQTVL